jgi:hypothetical protein
MEMEMQRAHRKIIKSLKTNFISKPVDPAWKFPGEVFMPLAMNLNYQTQR